MTFSPGQCTKIQPIWCRRPLLTQMGLYGKCCLLSIKFLEFSFLGPSCCSYRCHTWRKRAHHSMHMRKVVTKTGQCVRRQYPRGSPSSGSPPLSCSSCSSSVPVAPRPVFVRRHIASVKIFATRHPWILVLVHNLGYLCLCPQHTQGLHALDHWSSGDRRSLCYRLCSTWGSEVPEWMQVGGSSCWLWTLCCDW